MGRPHRVFVHRSADPRAPKFAIHDLTSGTVTERDEVWLADAVFRVSTAQWFTYNPATGKSQVLNGGKPFGGANLFDLPAGGPAGALAAGQPFPFPATHTWTFGAGGTVLNDAVYLAPQVQDASTSIVTLDPNHKDRAGRN